MVTNSMPVPMEIGMDDLRAPCENSLGVIMDDTTVPSSGTGQSPCSSRANKEKPDVTVNNFSMDDLGAPCENSSDLLMDDTTVPSSDTGQTPCSSQANFAKHGNNSDIQDGEIRYFDKIGETNANEKVDVQNSLLKKSSDTVPSSNQVSGPEGSMSNVSKSSVNNDTIKPPTYNDYKYGNVELYAPDRGPKIYNVRGNIVTPPIITKNLPEAFRALPVYGRVEDADGLEKLNQQKMRDYLGYGISDEEYTKLEHYCSPDFLKSGLEMVMSHNYPVQGALPADLRIVPQDSGPGENLCIVKKLKLRKKKDSTNYYPRKLKYRGMRMMPLSLENEDQMGAGATAEDEPPLEPGRDLVFRLRFYRHYTYGDKDNVKSNRHSIFDNDLVMLGRQRLTVLRDRIGCPNDVGLRVDVSANPDAFQSQAAKQMFPSGFLFINNVFYVDRRRGCLDHSAGIRDWARRRGIGDFPVRDMADVRLDQVLVRLGHPEVYMHQGKCEHLFTVSEVRLLSPADPPRLEQYPCHTAISQNQSVYCTTCAEFGARWLVVGCARVPFDPAFFCETCFKLYLYDAEGNKIGDFKAYSYKANTVNFLKATPGLTEREGDQVDCVDK